MDNTEKLMDTIESLIQQLNETELAIPSVKQGINPDAYYTIKELAEVLNVSGSLKCKHKNNSNAA